MAKLLLIQNSWTELYGFMSIASYVKNKHDVRVLIQTKQLEHLISEYQPDVIGLYVLTLDHFWAIETARKIKRVNSEIKVILGGPHPTVYHRILNEPEVDGIVVGEGEIPIRNLLDQLDARLPIDNIGGLWIKKGNQIIKNNLEKILPAEQIPIPDRSIYQDYPKIISNPSLQVICTRGCPFNCSFCINYSYIGMFGRKYYRIRKPLDIIEEINEVMRYRKIQNIKIQDDIFGMNKEWLDEFLMYYKKEVNIPYYSLLRIDVITEELLDKLIDSGCYEIGIGIESGNEVLRNVVLNKRLSNTKIFDKINLLKKKNIAFHTFNMFCLPNETLKEAWETIKLNSELKPDVVWSAIFQPYPGTKFFNEEVEKYIISKSFNRFKTNYHYTKDFPKIQRLQKFFMLTIKYPFIKLFLPYLIRLPLDNPYDVISKLAWELLYSKSINKKMGFIRIKRT